MNRQIALFFGGVTALALGCQASVREFGGGSGGGGTGGAGGDMTSSSTGTPVACSTDADCPLVSVCVVPSCDVTAGLCVDIPLPDGPIPDVEDFPNDCVDYLCSAGEKATLADDTEIPDSIGECAVPSCSGGAPTYTNQPAGMACGGAGGLCDGAGSCVDCLADGIKNGLETDVDCGGAGNGCVLCEDGKACGKDADCASTQCCTACSGLCIPAAAMCQPC